MRDGRFVRFDRRLGRRTRRSSGSSVRLFKGITSRLRYSHESSMRNQRKVCKDFVWSELVFFNIFCSFFRRNCACQGVVDTTAGASFSFGCSWSMYFNTCKFAKSVTPKKFKLTSKSAEKAIEVKCNLLADTVGPLYKRMAPASYKNQVGVFRSI